MKTIFKYLPLHLLFLLSIPSSHSQIEQELYSVRGTVGDHLVYHFAGTLDDITAQCTGGFTLMQFTDPILENDSIPFWTANGIEFRPAAPADHVVVCANIVDHAEQNEMASLDAQYKIKGVIDEIFEYEFQGTFNEVFVYAEQWIMDNQIENAFILTVETWDGRTITYENALVWIASDLPHIMRALAIFVEPSEIQSWEIYE